jgi:REP element-mobilizing transposase RayT
MAHRFFQVYIHLVWRTKFNRPVLTGELELFVHRQMRTLGTSLKLDPLAVNSAWNHTHSLFGWHPSVAIADAVRQMKSCIASEWNAGVDAGIYKGPRLEWQVGYGAISIRRCAIPIVARYIENQKEHHRSHRLSVDFERVRESEVAQRIGIEGGV